jgi:hypothetical protein
MYYVPVDRGINHHAATLVNRAFKCGPRYSGKKQSRHSSFVGLLNPTSAAAAAATLTPLQTDLPGRIHLNLKFSKDMGKAEVELCPRKAATQYQYHTAMSQKVGDTHLEPRQLRGPFEKATSHLSRSFPFSPSHRSGLNLSGSGKMLGLRCTK